MPIILRTLVPFVFAYLVANLVRVVNAVAGGPISEDLGLTAADLGLLTSVYFIGFAAAQLPFGILMDRYGPRLVEATTLIIAVAGCLIFALAPSLLALAAGRFLIGVGSAVVLMAPLTAYRIAFSPQRLPLITGVHMAFGALGAALGGIPAQAALAATGWQGLFFILAKIILLSAFLIFALAPRRHADATPTPIAELAKDLGTIFTARSFWRLAPLICTSHIALLSVVTLWSGPWLTDVAGLSPRAASAWFSFSAIGLLVGFLMFGAIVSRAERRGKGVHVFALVSLAHLAITVLMMVLPPAIATPMWLVYSLTGTIAVFSYAMVTADFPPEMAGRVNTCVNFAVFAFAFVAQWVFGIVVDVVATTQPIATAYNASFALQIIVTLLTFIPLIALRPRPETHIAHASRG